MRNILLCACLCVSVGLLASEREISKEVWINGSSFYKSIKHKKQSTIYFKEWSAFIEQFRKDEEYFVALQLDATFDPIPTDAIALPSLQTIAAVGDESVRTAYFNFLKNFGRTHGLNYLVLPDTNEVSNLEREVLNQANQLDPFYFLHAASLSYTLPESRKEFETSVHRNQPIWIAEQGDKIGKLDRWSDKSEGGDYEAYYEQLLAARNASYLPVTSLPESLKESIFLTSVIAIDPHQQLPLSNDQLTYLGVDQELKGYLKRYVNVIDFRIPGIPCLTDLRTMQSDLREGDIALYRGDNMHAEGLLLPEVRLQEEHLYLAQMLFGAREVVGRSDVSNTRQIPNLHFLGYADPKHAHMSAEELDQMDSLAAEAIRKLATPGIQVVVVKEGNIVVERAYGHYTYDSLRPVDSSTIYDVASVTKVVATLPAIALLIDQGKIALDDSIGMHLKRFQGSNKSGITVKQLLAHNGGLRSYVPFWSMMMDGDRLDVFYYKTAEDEAMDIRTYGVEPSPVMLDSLKSYIVQSDLVKNVDRYNYSDLGFMILHMLIEEVSQQSFDEFLKKHFYRPMGLAHTGFNPLKNGISPERIAPTEFDHRYRNYQVWGEVHDRNALVFGGVAGHAGVFSNATDLAKMMSMFINRGYYGGRQYLSKETLELLNVRYFSNNRRGLGWDKKGGKQDSASGLASDQSFGHTGFTGTMVWADPEHDLIFVFLSNRIYPDANNWRLGRLNTRSNIHHVIYKSLDNFVGRN